MPEVQTTSEASLCAWREHVAALARLVLVQFVAERSQPAEGRSPEIDPESMRWLLTAASAPESPEEGAPVLLGRLFRAVLVDRVVGQHDTAPYWALLDALGAVEDSMPGRWPLSTEGMRLQRLVHACQHLRELGIEQERVGQCLAALVARRPMLGRDSSGAHVLDEIDRLISAHAERAMARLDPSRPKANSLAGDAVGERDLVGLSVDELEGEALDFAVAVALGGKPDFGASSDRAGLNRGADLSSRMVWTWPASGGQATRYSAGTRRYSSEMEIECAGGLALREGIEIRRLELDLWQASIDEDWSDAWQQARFGKTAQVAVLRCFVAHRMGPVVEVPAPFLGNREGTIDADRPSAPRERAGHG